MKRPITVTIALLTFSLLLGSCAAPEYQCNDPLGCLEIPPGSPVVIGALVTVYGNHGKEGLQTLKEITSDTTETGIIPGHEIKLVWQGTDCTEENARTAATLLSLTSNLLAVIGPTCTADAQFVLPIFEDAGLSVISPFPNATNAVHRFFIELGQSAIRQKDGTLIIPRTILQKAIQDQP